MKQLCLTIKKLRILFLLAILQPYISAEPYKYQRLINPETGVVIDLIGDVHIPMDDPEVESLPNQEYLLPQEKNIFSLSSRTLFATLRKIAQERPEPTTLFWEFDNHKEHSFKGKHVSQPLLYASNFKDSIQDSPMQVVFNDTYRNLHKSTLELIGWQIDNLNTATSKNFPAVHDLEELKKAAPEHLHQTIEATWNNFFDKTLDPQLQKLNQKNIQKIIHSKQKRKPVTLQAKLMDHELLIKLFTDTNKHKVVYAGSLHTDVIGKHLIDNFGFKPYITLGSNAYVQFVPEAWQFLEESPEDSIQKMQNHNPHNAFVTYDVDTKTIGDNPEQISKIINTGKENFVDFTPYFIRKAACYNWPKTAAQLALNTAFINSQYKNKSPLEIAVKKENNKVVQIYLEHGADPNSKQLLHSVPLNSNAKITKLLVQYGADTQAQDKDEEIPLINAILHYRTKIFDLLVTEGFDTLQGQKALNYAAQKANTSFIKKLLVHGVDPNCPALVNTPLKISVKNNDFNSALILLDNSADPDGGKTYPIFDAIENNNVQLLELLLEHGATPNCVNESKVSPLATTIIEDKPKLIQLLLNYNADTNLGEKKPLDYALLSDNPNHELIKQLIAHGADINALNHQNITRLDWACNKGKYDLAQLLLELGANPNIGEDKPLDDALLGDNPDHELIKQLIAHGADINALNHQNITRLNWACNREKYDLAKLLLELGADPNIGEEKPLNHALLADNPDHDLIKQLVKHGADINARDKKNRTNLHCMVQANQYDLAQLLLELGADPQAFDQYGCAPLIYPLTDNNVNYAIAKKLIKKGANINNISKDNTRNLMHYAAFSSPNLLPFLHKHNADINAKDENGNTPLHVAFIYNHTEVAEQLIQYGADTEIKNNNGKTSFDELTEKITRLKQLKNKIIQKN